VGRGLDERGVEPLAMKIFAGIVLLVIGLGIGYGVYMWASGGVQQTLSFSVTVSPSCTVGIPASGENTKTVSVSVEKIGTYDKTVTLDATGEPDNVTVSFSPKSGVPEFGSTMTIRVSSGATPGTTTLTIRATGADGIEKVATFTLTLV
jgi:aminopeptidase S